MNHLFSFLETDDSIRSGAAFFAKPGRYGVYGLGGSVKAAFAACGIAAAPAHLLIVAATKEQVAAWHTDLRFFAAGREIYEFPFVDRASFHTTARSMERAALQMEILGRLRGEKPIIVLASAEEAAQYIVGPQQIDSSAVALRVGAEYDREKLLTDLVADGYERVDMVERRGHFSVRGDIIDIYAVNYEEPLRFAFFGDGLESIRPFDPISQTSVGTLSSVRILPLSLAADGGEYTLLDYAANGVIIWDEANRIREALKKSLGETAEYGRQLAPWRTWAGKNRQGTEIVLSLLSQAAAELAPQAVTSFTAKIVATFQKQFNLLADELHEWLQKEYSVIFVMTGRDRSRSLAAWLRQCGLAYKELDGQIEVTGPGMYIVSGEIGNGFELPYAKTVFVAERDVYGMQKKRLRRHFGKAQEISAFTDLKSGDYVVHEMHGIGRYLGIKTIAVNGVHKDYLEIHYAGQDVLYVPTDQLELLQRYIGNEGDTPKLHRMGGSDWQKARSKAQKSIDDLAEKLVALYAKREVVEGFAFPPDTPFQQEFEEAFPYEETQDQLKAVQEIKTAMEAPAPMDCLVCGDVGFGKTEVAIRAVFKAVMGGKQVAVLVPTTVLAQQHFKTFTERFRSFGVQCEVLNRFRSYKERKSILARTADGAVDVLIGTHSILNKNVQFKNLGLLVVDEEQRFGVAQKEKWKAWSAHIDVLTLSATPIPRTLHMSLVHLRQMCIIDTAPIDRFPVQTYVTEYDARIVRDAVMREKRRGGQVFFVYNRVASIDRMRLELEALLPDIAVGTAHGQMTGPLLEQTMFDFYEGKYDVLLCTSLIENGLDIANANTIIIYDADRLGLSQLYQMRGRVGRSHRMAYAYFLYRRNKVLSEVAEKRLQAIKEFTELGSGFKIAMRDLEIRGAGNLLGREQHGNIASVGFAMYCTMLEEAIAKVRHAERREKPVLHTVFEVHVDAFIDAAYIANGGQKIEMYQRLALVRNTDELAALKKELIDRYGKPTRPVATLLFATRLRLQGRSLGLVYIGQKAEYIELKWKEVAVMPPAAALEPVLRRRCRPVPGIPTLLRFSLKNIPDVLTYIEYIFQGFEKVRKERSFA